MKNQKWEKRYTITFHNGEKVTATGSMFNTMSIAFHECAERQCELGCNALAKEYFRLAGDIHKYLENKGYYKEV